MELPNHLPMNAMPVVGALCLGLAAAFALSAALPAIVPLWGALLRVARRVFGVGGLEPGSARLVLVAFALAPLAGGGLGFYLVGHLLGALVFAFLAVITVQVYKNGLRDAQDALLERQLPPAIDQLVAMMRGHLTLSHTMGELSRTLPDPVRRVFAEVHRRDVLFTPLDQCFEAAAAEARSANLRLLLSALAVFARQGGNAIEPLQEMSQAFKEIIRLTNKLRTSSSEARANFRTINGAAAFMVMTIWLSQPDLIRVLTTNAIGAVLVLVAGTFWLAGFFWMRRMVRIRI